MPEVGRQIVRTIADNPGQFALIGATAIVATRAAANIVRPRTLVEALALMIVLDVGLLWGIAKSVDSGLLPFRVRDEAGQLVLVRGAA